MNRLIKYTLTVVLAVAMSSCHIYRKYELPADENAFVEDFCEVKLLFEKHKCIICVGDTADYLGAHSLFVILHLLYGDFRTSFSVENLTEDKRQLCKARQITGASWRRYRISDKA